MLPVTLAAAVAVALAVTDLLAESPSRTALAGLLALFAIAAFTEAFPLPIRGIPIGTTSLASVFVIGTAVLYGWAPATLVSFLVQLTVELARRRPVVRVAYNSSVYALAALAAGLASAAPDGSSVDHVVETLAAAVAFYAVDLGLVALVVARSDGQPFGRLLARTIRSTVLPLTILVSVSVVLVILWERSPFLVAALLGPLVAFDLYQRSQLRMLAAMEQALTDPLTGLGNRRRLDQRLGAEIPSAGSAPVSVCLFDVDGLKAINDELGHVAGDRALAAVGDRLAQSGQAFRLGGDEFALLLPGLDAEQARLLVELVLVELAYDPGLETPVRVSGGIATYPADGDSGWELVARADEALYRSKRDAPGSVHVFGTDVVDGRSAVKAPAERATALETALQLARLVDARHPGSHSESVGKLAARIAGCLGCSAEQSRLIGLAGRLHDIGKVLIPEELVEKAAPLDEDEQRVLERHPAVGADVLASLGLVSVAPWVLHHHERWDGGGYPEGLAGDEIPVEARILAVADAYEGLIGSDALSTDAALEELRRGAGSRFDPAVVEALVATVRATAATARD